MLCVPLLLALSLVGCGSATSPGTIPPVSFKSAAVGTSMPARYTCDGENIAPPMEWGAVPAHSSQIVLLLTGFTPVPNSKSVKIDSVSWAVSGISPHLRRLAAGQIPAGAHVGHTRDGKRRYSVCPKRGAIEYYQFELYAVPATLKIPTKFSDLEAFSVLNSSGANGTSATKIAVAHGAFVTTYKRSTHQ